MQHSLTVIPVNTNLPLTDNSTQCTVGADNANVYTIKLLSVQNNLITIFYTSTNVLIYTNDLYNSMTTLNITYCYTQCNIKTTNLTYTQQYILLQCNIKTTNLSYTQQCILLHSAISKQQTYPTLNSTYCYSAISKQQTYPTLNSTYCYSAISKQQTYPTLNSTYCYSAISKQQTYPTLNSTYCYTVRFQNNKPILYSTVHIVTQCNIKTTNLSHT